MAGNICGEPPPSSPRNHPCLAPETDLKWVGLQLEKRIRPIAENGSGEWASTITAGRPFFIGAYVPGENNPLGAGVGELPGLGHGHPAVGARLAAGA